MMQLYDNIHGTVIQYMWFCCVIGMQRTLSVSVSVVNASMAWMEGTNLSMLNIWFPTNFLQCMNQHP
jgi:hypothetical protein